MSGVKTYDPKKFVANFAGIKLNEGIGDGTFIAISKSGLAAFSSKAGVDGTVTRSRQHDKRKIVKLTVMQTSEVNDRLSAILNADRAAINGRGVGAFYLQDLSGTTLIEGAKAWIMDDPDLSLEVTASTREWAIEIASVDDPIHGSNPDE
jgi:hypothetical protein